MQEKTKTVIQNRSPMKQLLCVRLLSVIELQNQIKNRFIRNKLQIDFSYVTEIIRLLTDLFSVKKICMATSNEITISNSCNKTFVAVLPIKFILKKYQKVL